MPQLTNDRFAQMRALAAEALGTMLLLAAVVGSGIMGERLAEGNAAMAGLYISAGDWFTALTSFANPFVNQRPILPANFRP